MEPQDHLLAEARRYGYVEGDQVWLRSFMDLPARRVGQVKESEEASLQYFAQRFESFRAKVEDLLAKIEESENKGSFLMKALHLKEQMASYDALGDFEALHHRLTEAEEGIKVTVARNREKNLNTKITLIQEAEALRDSIDWQTAGEKLQELRQAWIKTGPVEKHLTEELENRFREAVDQFFVRKKEFLADKKAMSNRVVDKYRDLIRKSEAIQNSEDYEETTRQLKQLQQDWKEVGGSLPRKQANELWTRFRAAHNHFFDRLKEHISTKRVDAKDGYMDDNLSRKRALVAEAEALLNQPMSAAVARAKELQAAWKKVGPVRGEESDRVWEQFIMACDKVFEMSALEHFIRKRQPNTPETGSPEDKINARVQALRDFIKYDKQEQEVLVENLGKLSDSPGNETFRNMLEGKIRGFERKIRTKTDLIELLRQRLPA
ncbi:hypothetical protein GCM10011375_08780 [Hymenobacter qilianensis]|uniref:Uncharacterized protein n=2 Tax=Hymenobacter qilianensis TaxID=1385715 RepID=A0ACB5PNB9_9BACT|nr:DUF349 domain-containing protein [Hymenobacter qilianensis]QNP53503.1 DUF349 domain-containing protein [Hymenobacter qilianensis]GGF55870.1 hypothetical protein GCM10011375_08780 [Hymenobacter qilianensis]